MIASPLNYTGNKSRLLSQIIPLFPKNIDRFIDLCCGGASVGINADAKKIICVDSNPYVINLLQTLYKTEEKEILTKLDGIISHFNLSDSFHKGYSYYKNFVIGNNGLKAFNKIQYANLRDFYNTHKFRTKKEKSLFLFALISYCFNNDIRFNSKGMFNMPVGKTDFNASIRKKLNSFKIGLRKKHIRFYHADFSVIKEFKPTTKDFIYVDPPYLITDAVYNENGGWNEECEKELLEILLDLHKQGIKFALSNVLQKKGQTNYILKQWIKENKFNMAFLDYHYRSSSYNKKERNSKEQEILVYNYEI